MAFVLGDSQGGGVVVDHIDGSLKIWQFLFYPRDVFFLQFSHDQDAAGIGTCGLCLTRCEERLIRLWHFSRDWFGSQRVIEIENAEESKEGHQQDEIATSDHGSIVWHPDLRRLRKSRGKWEVFQGCEKELVRGR